MIAEILEYGAANARTGKELAMALNCDIRSVTVQIETERREGKAICASMKRDNCGYFLARTPEELEKYCEQLYKRAGEIFKTRRALLEVLKEFKAKETKER